MDNGRMARYTKKNILIVQDCFEGNVAVLNNTEALQITASNNVS